MNEESSSSDGIPKEWHRAYLKTFDDELWRKKFPFEWVYEQEKLHEATREHGRRSLSSGVQLVLLNKYEDEKKSGEGLKDFITRESFNMCPSDEKVGRSMLLFHMFLTSRVTLRFTSKSMEKVAYNSYSFVLHSQVLSLLTSTLGQNVYRVIVIKERYKNTKQSLQDDEEEEEENDETDEEQYKPDQKRRKTVSREVYAVRSGPPLPSTPQIRSQQDLLSERSSFAKPIQDQNKKDKDPVLVDVLEMVQSLKPINMSNKRKKQESESMIEELTKMRDDLQKEIKKVDNMEKAFISLVHKYKQITDSWNFK